jgi:hypothetical protein
MHDGSSVSVAAMAVPASHQQLSNEEEEEGLQGVFKRHQQLSNAESALYSPCCLATCKPRQQQQEQRG